MTTTTRPQDFPTYKNIDTSTYSDDDLLGMAIRPITEVIRGLITYYNQDVYWVNRNAYVPWNISATLLNDIFGFFGWDTHETSNDTYSRDFTDKNGVTRLETIYTAGLRLTVRAKMPDGSIITKTVENIGSAAPGAYTDALDTAVKAARSDALSRACKLLGNAFGLYFYEKETEQQVAQPYTPNTTSSGSAAYTPRPAASNGGNSSSVPATDPQRGLLVKIGFPASLANHPDLTKTNASNAIKAVKESNQSIDQATLLLKVSEEAVPAGRSSSQKQPW
jgi:Rad52/22 family double-strand break repair protein